jgi:hypothetical protein
MLDNAFARSLEFEQQDQTSNVGGIVDRSGFGAISVLIATAVIEDGTHTLVVEHSDTEENADFTDASSFLSDSLPVLVTGGDYDKQLYKVFYLGYKRYLRIKSTVVSPTDGGTYGGFFVLGNPAQSPAVYQDAQE